MIPHAFKAMLHQQLKSAIKLIVIGQSLNLAEVGAGFITLSRLAKFAFSKYWVIK